MNVTTREKQSSTNELHDWIDSEVPQMIDDEIVEMKDIKDNDYVGNDITFQVHKTGVI